MRILLVSQMYPGPEAPDYGVFVRDLADAVERRGHEIERVVIDRRGAGLGKYLSLARRGRAAPRADVVGSHFLFPPGLAALAGRAPVVGAPDGPHGRDICTG